MHMNVTYKAVCFSIVSLFLITFAQQVQAQRRVLRPPQILSSDISRNQVVEKDHLNVTFVVRDNDKITQVVINNENQDIDPGKLVVVKKIFELKDFENLVTVSATDERGNTRSKSYLLIVKTKTLGPQPVLPQNIAFPELGKARSADLLLPLPPPNPFGARR